VFPLYQNKAAYFAARYKKEEPMPGYYAGAAYPFVLVDGRGQELGTAVFVPDRRGVEVTCNSPLPSWEAAVIAVGKDPARGQWFGSGNYRTFVYGRVNPGDPELSSERVVVRSDLKWFVVGVSR